MTVGTADQPASILPTKRNDVVFHELDCEAVLFDQTSGAVHRFNETTLAVWNACDGTCDASAIARIIANKYALESDVAQTEVDNVIRDLKAKGLLIERPEPTTQPASRLPSRRELLCGGTAKLIYTAPLISTFFASGACASGPSASGAWGAGCKNVGYSCSVNGDCCENPTKTKCQNVGPRAGTCCIQHNEFPCTLDTQCCNVGDTCNAGICN